MKTINLDTLRINIFKELISLDKESLTKVCALVTLLKNKAAAKEQEQEYEMPEGMLQAIVTEAEEQIKRGEVYSTEEVMQGVEQEMGWK